MGWKKGHGRVFNAATNATMETRDRRIELGTMCRWRVYIAARRERKRERLWEARRVHRRPCNLVIDQFVTIWHFVCTGPVNCVYPGHDDRRVNRVCLGTINLTSCPPSGCPFDTKECCPCPFSILVLFFPRASPLFSTDVARTTLFVGNKDLFCRLIVLITDEIDRSLYIIISCDFSNDVKKRRIYRKETRIFDIIINRMGEEWRLSDRRLKNRQRKPY